MARWIALLILALSCSWPISAQTQDSLQQGELAERVRIDLQQVAPEDRAPLAYQNDSGHIFFRVRIGGQDRWGALDTGSSSSLLDLAVAREIGLPISEQSRRALVPNGGEISSYTTEAVSVLLPGQMTMNYEKLRAADLRTLRTASQEGVAFILGRDLLDEFFVLIDPDEKVLRFAPSGRFRAPSAYQAVQLHNEAPLVEVSVGDQTMLAMIDTGKSGDLDVQPQYWERIVPHDLTVATAIGGGLDGIARASRKVVVPEVALASFQLSDITLTERETIASWGQGSVGMGILGRFRLVIDIKAQTMWIAPRAVVDAEPADAP